MNNYQNSQSLKTAIFLNFSLKIKNSVCVDFSTTKTLFPANAYSSRIRKTFCSQELKWMRKTVKNK